MVTVPPGWDNAVSFAETALKSLPRSKISVTPGKVTVTAITDSPETHAARWVHEILALGREIRATVSTPSGLHPAAQADVVNDQELVNTLLAKARADSRLVCRREVPTGSNRPQTICMTVAERAAARERSMDVMRKTGISRPEIIP